MMDEIISGVQVIKMYAWERPFEKLIKFARKAELKIVIKSSYVRGLYMTFNLFTTRAALFCTLLTMVLTGQSITATKVFVFMLYFNIMSQNTAMFVRGISEIAELFVAIKRIEEFLMNDEHHTIVTYSNNHEVKSVTNDDMIQLKNVTVKWNVKSCDMALSNINLHVNKGQLIGIIGPVGSGKSSLLQTLLGEYRESTNFGDLFTKIYTVFHCVFDSPFLNNNYNNNNL